MSLEAWRSIFLGFCEVSRKHRKQHDATGKAACGRRAQRASERSERSKRSVRELEDALRSKVVPEGFCKHRRPRKFHLGWGRMVNIPPKWSQTPEFKTKRCFPFLIKTGLCWVVLEPKTRPKTPQEAPKTTPEAPRWPQDGPRRSQMAPRRPKTPPRASQNAPKGALTPPG